MEHGRRHKPLMLMKYADCELAHPKVKGVGFQRYDNYDAIEVPATDEETASRIITTYFPDADK